MNGRIALGLTIFIGAVLYLTTLQAYNGNLNMEDPFFSIQTKPTEAITDTLPPVKERTGDYINNQSSNPFDLKDPNAIEQKVEYDPASGRYLISEKIGNSFYRPPSYMSFDEFYQYTKKKQESEYFLQLSRNTQANANDPISRFDLTRELEARTIFGRPEIDIRPQGNIDLTFGADFQNIENPIIPERQRRQGGFDFDMNIQINVLGTIGDKMKLSTNYNTQATFDFDNQMKLEYTGHEDEIIKKIEAGHVSLPLRGSLIQGSQSLFGIKTEMQFGRLTVTNILSQQKSRRKQIQIQGGSQIQQFSVTADSYDENRHFFLSHYNRQTYERALRNMPQINTLFKITKIEVWVTNTRNQTEGVRDILAIADLGESIRGKVAAQNPTFQPPTAPVFPDVNGLPLPSDSANAIYQTLLNSPTARNLNNAVATLQSGQFQMSQQRDFEKVRARKLSPTEFTFHPDLGYVSLNIQLQPEDILGVSYEYTYNGKVYRVGEFAQESPINTDSLSVLYVKMLKSSTPRIDLPIWDLMMKNVYSLGAFQVNQEDFKLDIFYQNPGGGEIRNIPEGTGVSDQQLIALLNLDRLNSVGDPQPNGVFDFVPGVTINPRNGRIIFPVLEPFGSSLYAKFDTINEANIARKYVYDQLYDSTVIIAREYPEYNRYVIKGTYKSSVSSEISLGAFNIPRGSVTVRAGGQLLVEGQDYDIDYNIGRIRVLNESILNSGQPINVSFEDNTLFSFQTRTMIGTRLDYWINDNFTIGATHMRLAERPFTQKVNIGDDPITNNIYGADIQYSAEAPWLTKLVDKIPLVDTKEKSQISFTAEGAMLRPGHSKAVNLSEDKGGTAYLDDFEGASSFFDLRTPATNWVLASVPRNKRFPEAELIDSLQYGMNRARLAWYQIDNNVRRNGAETNAYTRLVQETEIFPNRTLENFQNFDVRPLDLAFYPEERGPYNFDAEPIPGLTAGADPLTGKLNAPSTRWAGIMRSLQNNNFEAANIEFIEFWVLSPFIDGFGGQGGNLYINLGNISEDILRDSRNFFENGLPREGSGARVDTTTWGRIPRVQAITNAFDNDPQAREAQDVGLDGLDDDGENAFFDNYFQRLTAIGVPNTVQTEMRKDPSNDNFVYYNDGDVFAQSDGILERYKAFNNTQANSQSPQGNIVTSSTNIPDTEDINKDNSLNESESYFEYKIPLRPDPNDPEKMAISQYITNTQVGQDGQVWYQFKVPIDQFTDKVGGIQDFRSIRFIRLYMTDFDEPVVLRFARLSLVRNQWRRYRRSLINSGLFPAPNDEDGTTFDLNAVNIEENSSKFPFPYVLPPGIEREQTIGSISNALQNEQALAINVCELQDGDARGIYKILNMDLRTFNSLKMFVHAESQTDLNPGELSMFMRIGSDFENNYYEYEIPLTMTPPGTAPVGDPQFDEDYKQLVWLAENEFDFPLELLRNLKIERNNNPNASLGTVYASNDPDKPNNPVRIKGNPDLGLVKGIMIGLRNTNGQGVPVCAEVWVNELRVNGFDERGGSAAIARLDLKGADFFTATASGNYSTIGFGSIEQKLADRAKEEVLQYDVATNVQLGKLFPKEFALNIPVYAQLSRTIRTPQFDPYQLDIPLRELLAAETDGQKRDSLRRQAQDYTAIQSLNFTNIRKERTSQKTPMPWDISNFSFTYAFNQTFRSDPTIESEVIDLHRGSFDYGYNRQAKYIEPFKKLIKSKNKYLGLVKDFNFNPVPNSLVFNTSLTRRFGETTYRFMDGLDNTWYDKRFNWDRNYAVQWNLSRALNINFNANNFAVIDEPDGLLDTQEKRDTVWNNIRNLGRNKNYIHSVNASYTVPTRKIPIIDWVQLKGQVNATYGWSAAALNMDSLGNVIQNSQTRQFNGDLDFVKFYNKSKYLQKINGRARPQRGNRGNNRDVRTSDNTSRDTKDKDGKDKDKKKKEREPSQAERALIRPLLAIRKFRLTYNEQLSSVTPGFMPSPRFIGMESGFGAPGYEYILGMQPSDAWLDEAAMNGWISPSIYLNQQVIRNYTQTIDGRLTLEPIPDFRVEVEARRNYTENHTQFFKIRDNNSTEFEHLTPRDVGSFSITFFTLNTMFEQLSGEEGNISQLFKTFEANRQVISQRLGTGTHLTDAGYTEGYGRIQQEVLIPAFIAAYTDEDPNIVDLDLFSRLPAPNWRVTYNGLAKLEGLKKIFASVNITHGYRSLLNVNSFVTDLDFDANNPFKLNPTANNYFAEFEIPDLVISEQLSPLIGIDVRTRNDVTARIDFKKSRNLALNFRDYQLSETKTSEFTIGFGYRAKGVVIPFLEGLQRATSNNANSDNRGGRNNRNNTAPQGNDMNFKFDFSFRDDVTVNHLIDQDNSVVTRGLRTIRISPSIDYVLNQQLTLRLFFDQSRTIPKTSQSFPITNTQAGLTIRFSLAN